MPPALTPFRFDRTWTFDVAPAELWAALARTEDFSRWWPWLRELSGDGLVPCGRTDCVVRAPIPYTLRFTVVVRELVPGRLVDAVVEGDLAGPARLEVDGDGAGSSVRLAWEVELRRPVLRAAARFGRPVMEWGHDWVVANGVEQFIRRALGVQGHHDNHDDGDNDDDGTTTMTVAPERPEVLPDGFPRIDPDPDGPAPFPPHEPQPEPDPLPDRPPMPEPPTEPLPQI